mmetsp:Transcript_23905/g.35086  ORF Transcript_23905/g.35086 Transcript_23905/m.35086 type:complete len:98 (-) Transcript_23905:318-611(-)
MSLVTIAEYSPQPLNSVECCNDDVLQQRRMMQPVADSKRRRKTWITRMFCCSTSHKRRTSPTETHLRTISRAASQTPPTVSTRKCNSGRQPAYNTEI